MSASFRRGPKRGHGRCASLRPKSCRTLPALAAIGENRLIVGTFAFTRALLSVALLQNQREVTMKRALIAVATVAILAPAAWVTEANAQANINPNVYPGNMGER